jgi:hypothetical protein
MRTISAKAMQAYMKKMSALNQAAADAMKGYIQKYGYMDIDAMIDYAYGLATKYGEGAASLAAQMYDAVAELSGQIFDPAIPAATPSYHQVAKTVQGVANQSQNENMMANAIGRLVKQTGADTTLQNALRDGAEFAWIPAGETCAFCITLASRGWQRASKAAIKGGHAEHIHSNCDCVYAIRFDSNTTVKGYDPDKYRAMYEDADGRTPKDKINAMRREFYAENKEEINEQKRSAYEKRQELNSSAAEETRV